MVPAKSRCDKNIYEIILFPIRDMVQSTKGYTGINPGGCEKEMEYRIQGAIYLLLISVSLLEIGIIVLLVM